MTSLEQALETRENRIRALQQQKQQMIQDIDLQAQRESQTISLIRTLIQEQAMIGAQLPSGTYSYGTTPVAAQPQPTPMQIPQPQQMPPQQMQQMPQQMPQTIVKEVFVEVVPKKVSDYLMRGTVYKQMLEDIVKLTEEEWNQLPPQRRQTYLDARQGNITEDVIATMEKCRDKRLKA
jgi:hypothetical protein